MYLYSAFEAGIVRSYDKQESIVSSGIQYNICKVKHHTVITRLWQKRVEKSDYYFYYIFVFSTKKGIMGRCPLKFHKKIYEIRRKVQARTTCGMPK